MLEASEETYGPERWAEHEFGLAKLGDQRLVRRLQKIAARFAEQPSASIPKACEGWAEAKAAYRFFGHRKLKLDALLETHLERTRERCLREELVLVVQDTTGLTYGDRAGLGLVGTGKDGAKGLWLHSSMAFCVEGRALGLVRVEPWQRPAADFGKAARRGELPIAEKESQRWLNSFTDCVRLAQSSGKTRWVNVADREADIYELFAAAAPHPEVGVIVRARHNRKTSEGVDLDRVLEATPIAGQITITVPRKPGVSARTAHLDVSYAQVKIKAPKRGCGPEVTLWAIEVRETGKKAGGIHWRLLSNLPVENLAAAVEKIKWYRLRWQIEEYHRMLKSGCQVEARQLETGARLMNVLAVDMVVAWRVLGLSRIARLSQEQTLEEHFSTEEIKVIKQYRARNGDKNTTELDLREAVRLIARMGGFLGRRGDGDPGAMTLWRGLEALAKMVLGWRLATTYG
jgi:hypothetical protein